MVFEATYLVAGLTPGHMSACCGQYGAQISKVLRPNNRSNGRFICLFMTVPITSSEYGACHPPYAKPPLVSSSGPPPACMTPSRVTNSSTITFLMTEFLQHLATFGADHVCSSVFPFFSLPHIRDDWWRAEIFAICTSLYSTSRERKKLLLSCSNPRPDSCLGKISRRACAFLDESLAWVLTEVALLRIYNMSMQQPAGFRHFTEVCEVASHVSRRCASHSPHKPSNIRAIYHLSQEARRYQ